MGTGEIETETLIVGRSYYSKEARCLVTPMQGKGDWAMTQCPCVGEQDD